MNIDLWSFILGIVSSIIIPGFIFIIKYFSDLKKKNDFIKLMKKEYIEPIVEKASSSLNINQTMSDINRITEEKLRMLNYLQKEELPYFTEANQFYFLRTVVYTIHIIGRVQKLSDKHDDKTKNLDKVIYELCKDFKKEVKSYAEFKTEFLP